MDLAGTPGDTPASWTLASADSLDWREWDGELVVYLDRLGSTHLLTPYAGAVFLTLLQGPENVHLDDLLARLASDAAAPAELEPVAEPLAAPGNEDRGYVLQVMAEFERIGLVRRH